MQGENRELLKKQLEFLELILKYRQVSKLLSSFLEPFESFVEADGRIRPSFHNTVCVTGRLSCSKPNVEQLPRNNAIANIRNLFVADDNNVLIVADYGGQELRIMAQESGDRAMLKSLRAGLDIHLQTANDFNNLGLSKLQLTEGTPEHKLSKTKHKPQRDDCKSVGFGIAYGKGAYGFSRDFGWSGDKAQEFIDRFLDRYPGLRRAIEKTHEQIRRYGFVRNMAGRKRRFPNFKKKSKWQKERCYRQGFNFKIQGYGAEVVKVAASNIILDSLLKLVNLVHDEIVVECPKWYVEQGMAYIQECMVKALPISIPWTVEMAYADRYGTCK